MDNQKQGWLDKIDQHLEDNKQIKSSVKDKQQELAQYRPRKGVREAKRYRRTTHQELKAAKRTYNKQIKAGADEKTLTASKARIDQAIKNKKAGKKVVKLAYRRNGGTPKRKVARKGYGALRLIGEQAWNGNDYLEDIVKTRQKIRQFHANKARTKALIRYGGNISKGIVKGAYHVGNRGYNLLRGRGFTRTPANRRWERAVASRIRAIRIRIARSNLGKTTKFTGKFLNFATKPMQIFLRNPLSLSGLACLFFMILLAAIFSGSGPLQQDQFEMNRTWLHLTQMDKKYSNDKVEYWSDIESVLLYTNFVHGDYDLTDTWLDPADENKRRQAKAAPGGNPSQYDKTMKDYISEIWYGLNGDKRDLAKKDEMIFRQMVDLYGRDSKSMYFKLSKDQLTEYEEQLKLVEEKGAFRSYQELAHPFYPPDDESSESPITITKRFGYSDSKDEIYNGSILQANHGHKLYAVYEGKVELVEKDGKTDLIIKDKDSEFTYKQIQDSRFKTGDTVKEGEEIATVGAASGQTVYYKKLETDKKGTEDDVWSHVNPGFYFPRVEYTQKTYQISSSSLDGDVRQRIDAAYKEVLKHEPNATKEGAAAMFGNFWTEGDMKSKRAEGDFLAPPLGASDTSWDDPSWLSIGGTEIYGPHRSNIIHRGLGYGQWTDTTDGSSRHTLLLEYAKSKGKKWYDMDLQIDFIFNGDNPYYQKIARQILTSTGDAKSLAVRFATYWEGNQGDKTVERQNNAQAAYEYLKNPTASTGGSTVSVPTDGDYAHIFNSPYTVLQPYGFTPWSTSSSLYSSTGGKHTGVDVATNNVSDGTDTPVFSMTDGEVYSVSYSALGGHAVTIKPDFGGYLYYGHLKYAPTVQQGQKVTKGQQIAVLGHSGMTDIYHVHLEYSSSPQISTSLGYDQDPSFLFQKSGTLQQNQVITP